ncbi:hypothetical protein niasHS_012995 [Heterodera schachtii]|uniref:Uncharacterized protein n=1 Tax=Heterodera schachtii TaxID=97005 RepID=A0ABD2IT28_HETSC
MSENLEREEETTESEEETEFIEGQEFATRAEEVLKSPAFWTPKTHRSVRDATPSKNVAGPGHSLSGLLHKELSHLFDALDMRNARIPITPHFNAT